MAPSAIAEHVQLQGKSDTSPASIQASVLHGPRDLRIETRTIADPLAGELQVAISATGICGSDLSYYTKFRNGDVQILSPLSLGHESAGVVVGIGEGVEGFTLGDRVAIEVGVPCDSCRSCQRGRYNLCQRMRFRSSAKTVPHFQGTLQERINHPAKWCHRVPDHVSTGSVALLEPLAVAIHATRRAVVGQGDTAIVLGAGAVGLLTAAMAKLSGATTVLIADINVSRVKFALDHGFATRGYVVTDNPHAAKEDHVHSVAKELANDVVAIAYAGELDAEGADVTFECTGKEVCTQAGLYATRPGGKLIMVGMGTPTQTLQMSASQWKEVDILGVFRYANTYPIGLKLLSAGVLPNLDAMITHRFQGLAEARDAFELASRAVDDEGNLVLKVLIESRQDRKCME
ncbi:chaperonin 10-like protein [Phyllosticta capitalensis]|uniref:Chaperonin 10-like protein n=1 Tax=Phyllosticta capitalensis TaxID=121624 RepID=A0ABR1YQI8_9PEZI